MISLEEANRWFTQFEPSDLPPHIQQIFQSVRADIQAGNLYQARLRLERAYHVSGHTSGRERVETLAACAVAYDQLGQCDKAANLLREAHRSAYDPHTRAVTLFMQGLALQETGRLPGFEEPLALWRDSLELFEKQARTIDPHLKRTAWYIEKARQIEAEMNLEATQPARPARSLRRPPAPDFDPDKTRAAISISAETVPIRLPDPPSPVEAPAEPGKTRVSRPFSVTLEAFPILDEIPAGSPAPVAVDSNRIGNLEIQEVLLEDRRHRLVNLRDRGRTINLNPFLSTGERLVVLRVNGDSMNRAGIDSGDYVLLRQTETAASGDIVAAEIIDEDDQATLKRLQLENGTFVLYPESTNPIHQPRAFSRMGKEFRVRGVALAVFKPIEEVNSF